MYRCQSVPWNTIMGSYGAQLQGDWLHYLLWCDFTDFQARHYSQQEKMLIQFFRKSILLYRAWFKNVTDNCYVTLYWWFVSEGKGKKPCLWSFGFSGLIFEVSSPIEPHVQTSDLKISTWRNFGREVECQSEERGDQSGGKTPGMVGTCKGSNTVHVPGDFWA